MTRLDRLKVVGWYAVGVVMAVAFGAAFGSAPFGGPLGTGVVVVPAMVATNVVMRTQGPARPIPRPLLAITIAVIASLQALVLAIGQATVGWQLGWWDNVPFAAFAAVLYPWAVSWLHRRMPGPSGLETGPDSGAVR